MIAPQSAATDWVSTVSDQLCDVPGFPGALVVSSGVARRRRGRALSSGARGRSLRATAFARPDHDCRISRWRVASVDARG